MFNLFGNPIRKHILIIIAIILFNLFLLFSLYPSIGMGSGLGIDVLFLFLFIVISVFFSLNFIVLSTILVKKALNNKRNKNLDLTGIYFKSFLISIPLMIGEILILPWVKLFK